MELDRLLPVWDHRERHRLAVRTRPAPDATAAIAAVEAVEWRDVPVFRLLMNFGSINAKRGQTARPFLDAMIAGGFSVLHRSPEELVVGAAATVTGPGNGVADLGEDPARGFRDFDRPGHYKVAFNFRCVNGELLTETRVVSTDPVTRRRFRRYWTVIRLPSGVIRREWLRAARRRLAAAG
ncbi:hypothetical protein ACPC54_08870 [Kitasatospora sp. NPDC094028]